MAIFSFLLSILVFILKILLILIVFLLILLSLFVLFPIKYDFYAKNGLLELKINFLYKLVNLNLDYKDTVLSYNFKILFFKLLDSNKNKKDIKKIVKNEFDKKNEDAKTDDSLKNEQAPKKEQSNNLDEIEKNNENKNDENKDYIDEIKALDRFSENEESEKKSFFEKIKNKFSTFNIRKINDAFANINKHKKAIKKVLLYPDNKLIINHIKNSLKKIIKCFNVDELELDAVLGLSDPANTAYLIAVSTLIFSELDDVYVEGIYNEEKIEYNFNIVGNLYLGKVIFILCLLLIKKEVRKYIKNILAWEDWLYE